MGGGGGGEGYMVLKFPFSLLLIIPDTVLLFFLDLLVSSWKIHVLKAVINLCGDAVVSVLDSFDQWFKTWPLPEKVLEFALRNVTKSCQCSKNGQ